VLIVVISILGLSISPNFKETLVCPMVGPTLTKFINLKCPDSDGSGRLQTLLALLETVLLISAIVYVFSNSNKGENTRYFDYPGYYLRKYKNESYRFLAVKKENKKTRAGTLKNLKLEETITKKVNEIAKRKKLSEQYISWAELHDINKTEIFEIIFSNSVAEYIPENPDQYSIEKVTFNLLDKSYELPWFISESGIELLARRFNISKADYNGMTLALDSYEKTSSELKLNFSQSFYYNYLLTNMLPEMEIMPKVSVRNLIEYGAAGKLNPLSCTLAENHPGMSCLISTKDGMLIIPKRSANVTVFKNQLSPSISGAVTNITSWDGEKYTASEWFKNELFEELKEALTEKQITDVTTNLKEIKFIGMTREVKRLGKPELFFSLELDIGSEDLREKIDEYNNKLKVDEELELIDEHENVKFLLINTDHLIDNLKSLTGGGYLARTIAKFNPTDRSAAKRGYFVTFDYSTEEKDLIISESLLCNLILFKSHRDKQT
jgi:hypothetical protein